MNSRALIPLIVFIAIGFLLWSGIGKDPRLVPSPLIGKPVPAFAAPSLADPQQKITRESLLGQPYLLNVFASWCVSCREEHPVLMDYSRKGGLKLVGFNWKDAPQDANRWLAQFGNPYAEVLTDLDGRLGIDFGVYGAPETFVIGADGTVLYKQVGPLSTDDIEKTILPLIAGKP
jgi:cytochrome c biogenesis protein CcmG, thiol:disulfide interchange protein DsbE